MSIIYKFKGKPEDFANRKKTQKYFTNSSDKTLIQPFQVHGKKIVEITEKNKNDEIEADGIWTREKNIILSVKTRAT